MSAELDRRAAAELEAAVEWYEVKRRGLGLDLLAEVRMAAEAAERSPMAGSLIDGLDSTLEVRRVSVRRFPYQVVYLVEPDGVVVIAVAHDRRSPAYWAARIGTDEGS